MVCNVTTEADHWQATAPHLDEFLAGMPNHATTPALWTPTYSEGFVGMTIPAQVNYVGKGANLYDMSYTYHGSTAVVLRYLNTSWIWEQVRVKGGAYGGFVRFDRLSGVFSYLSYRDPNLLGTLDVYDGTAQFLRKADIHESEVTKSIIGTIGGIDAYQLPDAKGYTSLIRYLLKDEEATRQRIREEVLGTTPTDFRAFADVLDWVQEQGTVVVIGSADSVEKANTARGTFLKRVKLV